MGIARSGNLDNDDDTAAATPPPTPSQPAAAAAIVEGRGDSRSTATSLERWVPTTSVQRYKLNLKASFETRISHFRFKS
jgi:hypothetical protein